MRDLTAKTIAKTLFETWIARYGIPLQITTDRGQQYRSQLFQELAKLLGSHHVKTTSYHPQSNGKIEIVHKRLKEALKCCDEDWVTALLAVLLGLQATPRDEDGIFRAEMTFGMTLTLSGEFI